MSGHHTGWCWRLCKRSTHVLTWHSNWVHLKNGISVSIALNCWRCEVQRLYFDFEYLSPGFCFCQSFEHFNLIFTCEQVTLLETINQNDRLSSLACSFYRVENTAFFLSFTFWTNVDFLWSPVSKWLCLHEFAGRGSVLFGMQEIDGTNPWTVFNCEIASHLAQCGRHVTCSCPPKEKQVFIYFSL